MHRTSSYPLFLSTVLFGLLACKRIHILVVIIITVILTVSILAQWAEPSLELLITFVFLAIAMHRWDRALETSPTSCRPTHSANMKQCNRIRKANPKARIFPLDEDSNEWISRIRARIPSADTFDSEGWCIICIPAEVEILNKHLYQNRAGLSP
ncbi:hypothetical protein BDQ12DRAFT_529039 [Crucibulum laeve]|uniref:Uncharacterized protein n=1 Tax=Crucibulum laeve TaxID=68775 RepID=A0A5C3LHJ1_9AGAR|nr:hypothetical protein BDQ12DRAFT_529039 [Crucibulum laeve]